ncbi:MAG: ABC transporter ATP-binding protein [Eubacteriales bacterium]|nr:ABC transporter ATP-binding protein [Eubacteriales bacterium]
MNKTVNKETQKVIEIKNVTVKYKNNTALDDVSLDVYRGEFLGIIGPNGGGKTTLLRTILGQNKKKNGEIIIFGEKQNHNHRIGYVPQFSSVDRNFPITVLEALMISSLGTGLHPFRRFGDADRETCEKYLELVHIQSLARRRISELSGGEFQRLLIARALALKPEILLLDEPTASVDPASRNMIYTLLSQLNRDGMTIVMVTHDMLAVSSSIGRIACLNRRLVYHGEPKLTEEICNEMYGCPIDLIAHGVPHRVLGSHRDNTSDRCEGGCHCDTHNY